MPGLGLLVEPGDGGRVGDEPVAEDLDGDRLAAGLLRAAVDAGEGPLGEVEEDLAAAEEEAGGVALLEPLDLPARQQPLAEERPGERRERAVLGVGDRLAGLTGG